jgi:hypothetical protein
VSEKRLIELSVLTGDLDASAAAWQKASGLRAELRGGERRMNVGDIVMRLISLGASVEAAEALAKHGEGLYELVIEVPNVVDTMSELRTLDVLVSGVELGEHHRKEIRIDPRSSHGVPIRIVEKK